MAQTRKTKPELIPFTMDDGKIIWLNPFKIDYIQETDQYYMIYMEKGKKGYKVPKDVGDNNAGVNSIE